MGIKISEEQLDEVINSLSIMISNNVSLTTSLNAVINELELQKLFGVEEDIKEKMEEYYSHFAGTYHEELETLLQNASNMKDNYIGLDTEIRGEVENERY